MEEERPRPPELPRSGRSPRLQRHSEEPDSKSINSLPSGSDSPSNQSPNSEPANESPFHSLTDVSDACAEHLRPLLETARVYVGKRNDQTVLIVGLIECSRRIDYDRTLEKRIRELESANDELLSLIGGRPVDGRMVNPFFLPKLIGEAEERIVKLRKTVAALERGVSEAGWKEEDAKKEYGREMMNVAALQKDVSTLQTNVQGLEKRIELMRQRRSHYAGYFRAHPDPALRVGETIDEMLRRWGEAPLI